MNSNLLKSEMVKVGHTNKDLADLLGLSEATIYNRLSGKNPFTQNEIMLIKETYHLSAQDVDAIFMGGS